MGDTNFSTDFSFKCHFCPVCDGTGCIGEIPGMGGNHNNENFRLNCDGWEVVRKKLTAENRLEEKLSQIKISDLRKFLSLAPVSGAVENVGYFDEKTFYKDIVEAAFYSGIDISIGDGCPDFKFLSAVEAVKMLSANENSDGKEVLANVFMKPYENEKIFERMDWADDVAKVFGVDIDSFNIATMKRQVVLEKKSSAQLLELKHQANKKGRPFAVKGVFTESDIDIVKNVCPDIIYISNHGGRVENRTGSTAEFFYNFGDVLKNYCNEIWVDGGIRTKEDFETALALDARKVLLGRPIISALCSGFLEDISPKEKVNEAVSLLAC